MNAYHRARFARDLFVDFPRSFRIKMIVARWS